MKAVRYLTLLFVAIVIIVASADFFGGYKDRNEAIFATQTAIATSVTPSATPTATQTPDPACSSAIPNSGDPPETFDWNDPVGWAGRNRLSALIVGLSGLILTTMTVFRHRL